MFRKVLVLTGAVLLASATLTSLPASGATKVSNGVSCKKAGATIKSNGTIYKCAKNELIKSTKLTWLSTGCIAAIKSYKDIVKGVPEAKKIRDEKIAEITKSIELAKEKIAKYKSEITRLNTELLALRADTANLAKNQKSIDDYVAAIKSYESAVRIYESAVRPAGQSESSIRQLNSDFESYNDEIASSRVSAQLFCKKGY